MKRVSVPFDHFSVRTLKAGDEVLLSGVIHTARDQAHLRLVDLLSKKKKMPFDLKGQVIYYAGPAPAPPGRPIGSLGPTTSSRMDPYTLRLLEAGLLGMIGKGPRAPYVYAAVKRFKAVYMVAAGGAGALLSDRVVSSEIIAFDELGPEAIRRLTIEDFPALVAADSDGKTIRLY